MFQLKHHTRKGHKTKLFAAVAYALAGLLASGSAYAVDQAEFDQVKNGLKTLTEMFAKEKTDLAAKEKALQDNYLKMLDTVKQEYPVYKDRFDKAEERLNILVDDMAEGNPDNIYGSIFGEQDTSLFSVITKHEGQLDEVAKAFNDLSDKVAKNETDFATKANQQDVDDKFAETKANVNKLAEETLKGIKHLNETKADKAAVEENKALIQATAEAVDETGKLLAALAPEVAETKEALNYKADQGYVDGMVKEIAERYDPVFDELKDLKENKLDKTELAKVEAAKTEVAAAKEEVKTEVANLKKSAAQITANKDKLAEVAQVLKEKTDALEGNVTAVDTKVEAQQTAINGLENRVNNFSNQINGLNNKVEKLEENFESGMAIQSAHAALFQPYRVGRVNVTAGLGGYKGKTALAVGVGYRFNERFAAKAGVAADTKGKRASYNLGVNFEF